MELLPVHRVDVFISFNTNTGGPANGPILNAFLDRYYPVAVTPQPKAAEGFSERAQTPPANTSRLAIPITR